MMILSWFKLNNWRNLRTHFVLHANHYKLQIKNDLYKVFNRITHSISQHTNVDLYIYIFLFFKDAITLKIKALHFINTKGSVIDTIMALIRPFLKESLLEKVIKWIYILNNKKKKKNKNRLKYKLFYITNK